MNPALPFPRSYWVEPGRLLAGFMPGDKDPAVAETKLSGLLDCGVTHVICLMEENECDHSGRAFSDYYPLLQKISAARQLQLQWTRRPIKDLNIPAAAEMSRTLDIVDDVIKNGGCAYIHCWGGRGRTGTVIGCWLARHGIATGDAALQQLTALTAHAREHFPHIPETLEQREFVRKWKPAQ